VFEIAEISNFTDSEIRDYEANMKYLNDYRNTIEYAKKESWDKGVAFGERRCEKRSVKKLFALWESGVSLAEAKRQFEHF